MSDVNWLDKLKSAKEKYECERARLEQLEQAKQYATDEAEAEAILAKVEARALQAAAKKVHEACLIDGGEHMHYDYVADRNSSNAPSQLYLRGATAIVFDRCEVAGLHPYLKRLEEGSGLARESYVALFIRF